MFCVLDDVLPRQKEKGKQRVFDYLRKPCGMRDYTAIDVANDRSEEWQGANGRIGMKRDIFLNHQPLHLGERRTVEDPARVMAQQPAGRDYGVELGR